MQLGAERVRTGWPYGYEYRIIDLKIQWTQFFTVVKAWQHAHERSSARAINQKSFTRVENLPLNRLPVD